MIRVFKTCSYPSIDQQRNRFVSLWHTAQPQSNHNFSKTPHQETFVLFYLNQRLSCAVTSQIDRMSMVKHAYPHSQTILLHPMLISIVLKVTRRSRNACSGSSSCYTFNDHRMTNGGEMCSASNVSLNLLYSCENTNAMQVSSIAQQFIVPSEAEHAELDRAETMVDLDHPTVGISYTSAPVSCQKSVTNVSWKLCTCSQRESSNEH